MTAVTDERPGIGRASVTLPSDTEILIEREFDAPKDLVYRAYTEPELIKRWWSAKRGAVTTCEVDLRVGGTWRYVMMTDDGFEVGFHGEFREIVPNERLVSTEVYEGAPGGDENGTLNTLTLTEIDGRTKLSVLVGAPSKFVRDMIISSGMEGGLQDAYDLLEEVAQSL
jgi:uncharacterized protein YndB with AHSA1/START domain